MTPLFRPVKHDHHTTPAAGRAFAFLLRHRLWLLILSYVGIYILIDLFVANVIRHYIFSIVLVVSSLYFSWYVGGREALLYTSFFNIFFAYIFSRLLYLSGGGIIAGHLFLGRSFIVLYVVMALFIYIILTKKSPADVQRESQEQFLQEERKRRHQLELMVATKKLTGDLVQQANRVKDELLLLQGSWKSQIHSIINDLPDVKERELYNQIVIPFQESIIAHLRNLESRLSFSPVVMPFSRLMQDIEQKIQEDNKRPGKQMHTELRANPEELNGNVYVDPNKTWEILLNLIRNSQSACELSRILMLKSNPQEFASYRPEIFIQATTSSTHAEIRVADNGGGMDEEKVSELFNQPLPSAKRGNGESGQGGMFVKFFGESMGMDIHAENTHLLQRPGLMVVLRLPLVTDNDFSHATRIRP